MCRNVAYITLKNSGIRQCCKDVEKNIVRSSLHPGACGFDASAVPACLRFAGDVDTNAVLALGGGALLPTGQTAQDTVRLLRGPCVCDGRLGSWSAPAVFADCTVCGVFGHNYVRERFAGHCEGNEVAVCCDVRCDQVEEVCREQQEWSGPISDVERDKMRLDSQQHVKGTNGSRPVYAKSTHHAHKQEEKSRHAARILTACFI
jgi:hypothetical protein